MSSQDFTSKLKSFSDALYRVLDKIVPSRSSHERNLPTGTVCDISGWRTRAVSLVAGPNITSPNPQRWNSAIATTAASNRLDAVISTACVIPSESVNETEHDRAVGTTAIMGEEKGNITVCLRRPQSSAGCVDKLLVKLCLSD
jgi:hypothetical protein